MKGTIWHRWRGELAAYALAIVGAGTAYVLSVPLAVLVGPTIVLSIASQRFPALKISPLSYGLALIAVGVSMGQFFSPDIVNAWREMGATLVMTMLLSFAGLAAGFALLRYVFRYDTDTAAFAALPGGILTVIEVSRQSNGDAGAVLFFQVFRIILGASLFPMGYALAGFDIPPGGIQAPQEAGPVTLWEIALLGPGSFALVFAGRYIRFPSAEISLPMIWSGFLFGSGIVTMTIPFWVPTIGFIVVGGAIGTFLPRPNARTLIRLTTHTVILFLAFVCLTFLASEIALSFLGLNQATGILAFSPASLTEMIALAAVLGLDPALVAANNIFRMVFCSFLAPLLLLMTRWATRRRM